LQTNNSALVFACDSGYLMPLATALRSIVETNQRGWPLKFNVLSDAVSEKSQKKVLNSLPPGSASICWVPVDLRLFSELSTVAYVSKMTYARLLIPRLFPNSVSRVLYLDSDTLVLDDLTPLLETDLNGNVVGAVLDCGVDPLLKRGEPLSQQVPCVRAYFNAGVLLIDLDRWREYQISEKTLEYLAKHPQSPFMDQDGLNFACDNLWKKLDSQWNFQGHFQQNFLHMNSEERPRIVHFVTSKKPWDPTVDSLNARFYDGFRSRTCFFRTPPDKLLDVLRRIWAGFKNELKQWEILVVIWRHLSSYRHK
jgi:lipopolysaccharide biosynthesis glycosyltransferase